MFTYLITRSSPLEFRSFLMRHFSLMRLLLRWTLRVLRSQEVREGDSGVQARRQRGVPTPAAAE
ncbi:MAG: hypothetical protein R2708_08895 [Vicinamibacterales bacterium]